MNISAPPTSSRGHSNASRTSSLTNLALATKIPPFHNSDSRTSSAKSSSPLIFDFNHTHQLSSSSNSPLVRPSKTTNRHKNSTTSLLRLSSNDSANGKHHRSESHNDRALLLTKNTSKSNYNRSRSLTAESGQKLDEFISNVKNSQQVAPSHQQKSPHKASSSSLPKPLKHNLSNIVTAETPNAKNKKRLVKQFYEDPRSSKGTSTPGRNNSLTMSNDAYSPITPEPLTQNIFNNYDLSDSELSTTDGRDEQELINLSLNNKSDQEPFTIDREILKLKLEVLNEVKSKVNQTEIDTLVLINSIELKKSELIELNKLLLSKYDEAKPKLLEVEQKDFSKYSLQNENAELDSSLTSLDTSLKKYRDLITHEKSLISEIDDDLEYLEKITLEKLQRAKQNRNRVAITVLIVAICYMCHILIY